MFLCNSLYHWLHGCGNSRMRCTLHTSIIIVGNCIIIWDRFWCLTWAFPILYFLRGFLCYYMICIMILFSSTYVITIIVAGLVRGVSSKIDWIFIYTTGCQAITLLCVSVLKSNSVELSGSIQFNQNMQQVLNI